MKAKAYVLDDIIIVVMRGRGLTALEQSRGLLRAEIKSSLRRYDSGAMPT